ncbi:NUDIX hydrolase [bacterium]|nr:NUDIX hydrolase [bacterium]
MTQQKTRIAAYGVIVREQKILLCRISAELPRWQGQWTLPGGGIEFGEAPEDAMVREVKEETGLVVSAGTILGIDSLHDKQTDQEIHGVRVVYSALIVRGKLKNENSGTTDLAQWFSQQELVNETLVDIAQFGVGFAFK